VYTDVYMPAYKIQFERLALDGMKKLSAYHQRIIATAIKNELVHDPEPEPPTDKKKRLQATRVPWSSQPEQPWQLTAVPFRILYDVDPDEWIVRIQLIIRKNRERTEQLI
jgi:mRNA-degrading endonuclease RelE of RelBE toxin-antitoxin system